MLGRGLFPEGEVGGIAFLRLSVQLACRGEEFVDVSA